MVNAATYDINITQKNSNTALSRTCEALSPSPMYTIPNILPSKKCTKSLTLTKN